LFHRLMNSCTKEQSSRQSKEQVVFSFFRLLCFWISLKKREIVKAQKLTIPLYSVQIIP
jgi:hypothetical protein